MNFQDAHYEQLKPLMVKYSSTLKDGVYIFDLYTDLAIIEILKEAMVKIYKGTYYVNQEQYHEKFVKKGNIFVAYVEDGKPVVASCLLWHDAKFGIFEIGQGFSFPHKSKTGFLGLAIAFNRIHHQIRKLPLMSISTCRKSATDETSEKFKMVMTGIFAGPSLRVDYERIFEMKDNCEEKYQGEFYNILYQMLNYHCRSYKKRLQRMMKIPPVIQNHVLLEKFWQFYPPYRKASIPFQAINIKPEEYNFSFDEANNQMQYSIWPVSHPDLPGKLETILNQKTQCGSSRETILGTAGPYFYDPEQDIFIPGILIIKGTFHPYYFSVKNEIYREFGSTWHNFPPSIQTALLEAFMGFNVTKQTRHFYHTNKQIFTNLGLDPRIHLGMTFAERKLVVKTCKKYPQKYSEKKVLSVLTEIIKKK